MMLDDAGFWPEVNDPTVSAQTERRVPVERRLCLRGLPFVPQGVPRFPLHAQLCAARCRSSRRPQHGAAPGATTQPAPEAVEPQKLPAGEDEPPHSVGRERSSSAGVTRLRDAPAGLSADRPAHGQKRPHTQGGGAGKERADQRPPRQMRRVRSRSNTSRKASSPITRARCRATLGSGASVASNAKAVTSSARHKHQADRGQESLHGRSRYSWRNASIGSIIAARRAGYIPNMTPVATEIPKARKIDHQLSTVSISDVAVTTNGMRTADQDPQQTTRGREDGGFDQELRRDVAASRTQRAANADFPRPLRDRGQHDVHDADAAHQAGRCRQSNPGPDSKSVSPAPPAATTPEGPEPRSHCPG